jgi:RNA polymerase sigma factor (sigma-70 family)
MPTDQATKPDVELLADFRLARSQEAFSHLVTRHQGMVYRTCARLLANHQDAEEATQAAFVMLAQQAGRIRESLAGWLHKVARDVAIQLLRTRARRARRERVAAMRQIGYALDPSAELREELDWALDRLPVPLREAVILRYLEGREQEEAARLAGCPRGTLSRRSSEGLNRLRSILARRGTVVAPAVLVGFMNQEATAAIPPASAASLQGVLAYSSAGAVHPAAVLAQSTAQAVLWSRLKLGGAVAIALLVAVLVALFVRRPDAASPILVQAHTGPIWKLCFLVNGDVLASGSGSERVVKLWELPDMREVGTLALSGTFRQMDRVDQRTLAVSLVGGAIEVWDVPSRGRKYLLREHQFGPTSLGHSTDGRWLASADSSTIKVWDLAAGTCRWTVMDQTFRDVRQVRFVDGNARLQASNASQVRVWDLASGSELLDRRRPISPNAILIARPDGRDDVLDLSADKQRFGVVVLNGHDPAIDMTGASGVAFSFTPELLALAAHRAGPYRIEVFDRDTRERVAVLSPLRPFSTMHMFSDSKKRAVVACGGRDGTIQLWVLP